MATKPTFVMQEFASPTTRLGEYSNTGNTLHSSAVEKPQGHAPIHDGIRAFPMQLRWIPSWTWLPSDRKSERERGKRNERAVCSMELGWHVALKRSKVILGMLLGMEMCGSSVRLGRGMTGHRYTNTASGIPGILREDIEGEKARNSAAR